MSAEKESAVEAYFCEQVALGGGFVAKFVDPTRRGAPDRIVFMPRGYAYFVELKRPKGGKYSEMQRQYHAELAKRGTYVYGLHNRLAVDSFLFQLFTAS